MPTDNQPLQAVSVPVTVGGVRWLRDRSASLNVTTSREYTIDELQPLYRLQQQPCEMLLQPEGLAVVEKPEPEPKKNKQATASQIQRLLLEDLWDASVPKVSMTKEEYYQARMQRNIERLQDELEKLTKPEQAK